MQTCMSFSIIALAAACAHMPNGGAGPSSSSAFELATPTARGEAVLPAAILAASVSTTYEAVRKLRPGFFVNGRTAGTGRAPTEPSAVLERGFPQPREVVKFVPPHIGAESSFVEPREAAVFYGPSYTRGVIVVLLKGGGMTRP